MRSVEGILSCEGAEILAQSAQRGCGCPIPGTIQGQVGRVLEQGGTEEGVPAHGMGVELDDFQVPSNGKYRSVALRKENRSLSAVAAAPARSHGKSVAGKEAQQLWLIAYFKK